MDSKKVNTYTDYKFNSEVLEVKGVKQIETLIKWARADLFKNYQQFAKKSSHFQNYLQQYDYII